MKHFGKRLTGFVLALALVLTSLSGIGSLVTPAKAANGGVAGSNLPQIYITITDPSYSGGTLNKDMGYMKTSIEVVDPTDSSHNLTDTGAEIKVRGNSTAGGAKRPYNFKLSGKTDVLGMGKGKKWCLLANMFDKSLMRNKLAYDFCHDIGLAFTPDTKMVDVWFNGSYSGCYLLSEPIEAKANRVDIDIDNGDFLFERERDRYESGVTYFNTPVFGQRFTAGDPEEFTPEQYTQLMELLRKAETAMQSNDYDTMAQAIDLNSFVDFYIALEYFKNADADFSSTRFYFQNGILYAGPAWDFDLSCGNCADSYYEYNNIGTTHNSYESFYVSTAIWYQYLMRNKQFCEQVRARYLELQPQIVNLYADNALGTNRIDRLLNECGVSFAANWTVWKENSQDSGIERVPEKTFAENVAYLRNWLRLRNEWMLNAINNKTSFLPPVGMIDGVYTFSIDEQMIDASQSSPALAGASHTNAQRFVAQKYDGYYSLRNLQTGKYLMPSGNNVVLQSSSSPVVWAVDTNDDGTFTLANRSNTNMVLTCSNGRLRMQSAVDDDPSQCWKGEVQNVLTDGVYKLASNGNSTYVLNVEGNSTENCANVYIWNRSNNKADQFVFESLPDGFYTVRALHSNYYLNVSGASRSEGANLIQYDDTSAPDNQIWSVVPNTDGSISLVSYLSGLYVDIASGTNANGTNVRMWTGNGTNAQKWKPEIQKTIKDGVYQADFEQSQLGKAQDDVALLPATTDNNTKLVIQMQGTGEYTVRFVSDNSYLGASAIPGSDILANGDAQKWSIVPDHDGTYHLVSFDGNLQLTRGETDLVAGHAVFGSAQMWALKPASIGLDGVYTVSTTVNSAYLLDIGENDTSGAKLQVARPNAITDSQKWILQSREDRYYVLRSLYSGRMIAADSAAVSNGIRVAQISDGETADTLARWQLIPNVDGTYSLLCMASGLYLQLSGASAYTGCAVNLNRRNDTAAAQKWTLNSRFACMDDGTYPIKTNDSALTLTDGSLSMDAYTGAENQQFVITHTADAYYTIATADGKYLSGSGKTLALAEDGSADACLWTLLPNPDDTCTFVCKATGHSLDETLALLPGTGTGDQKFQSGPHRHKYVGTTTKPTCLEAGYTTYTCTECGDSYTADEVPALGHNPVVDPAVDPNCTQTGLTEGSHCERCGKVLVEQQTVPTRHQPVDDPAVEPTCTSYGLSAGSHCAICGQTIVPQTVIPGGHVIVQNIAVEPTCTTEGLSAGSYCTRCGMTFGGREVIPALGHEWDAGVRTQPTCTEPGHITYTCTRCHEQSTDTLPATGHQPVTDPGTPATCTESGLTDGIHCATCGAVITAQEVIPATGHQPVTDPGTPATCTQDGLTDGSHCATCGAVITAQEVIPATGHQSVTDPGKPATCTESGLTDGSHCAVCDAILTVPEPTPALGHDWDAGVAVPNEICSAVNDMKYTCRRCGETQIIGSTEGHAVVVDPAVPATCTQDGLTEGSHCSACGTIIVPQQVIAATGHSVVTDPAKSATCTQDGLTEGSHCKTCGLVLTAQETIPALGHDMVLTSHVDCTEVDDGYDQFTCQRCGYVAREAIPATGCPSTAFDDVDRSKWYHASVDYMVSMGYMQGMTTHYFGLTENVTRGQLVAILYRIAGSPDSAQWTHPFTDVADNRFYSKAVAWAYGNKVVAGISKTQFAPNQPVTREQLASILYRSKGQPAVSGDYLADFPDRASVSKYAVPAINWAVRTGLISGNQLGSTVLLQPKDNASRAQCASILHRFLTKTGN